MSVNHPLPRNADLVKQLCILNTPGELVRSVKLYIEGRDKPHEFNLGPGPCGRTVRALKFLDKGPTLEIHQFCEDQKRADVFTYRIEKLVHWTIYRCN